MAVPADFARVGVTKPELDVVIGLGGVAQQRGVRVPEPVEGGASWDAGSGPDQGLPEVPRYLALVHLGALTWAPILLGLVWAVRLSHLTPWVEMLAAGLLVDKLIKAGDIEGSIMRFVRGVLGEQALAELPDELRPHMLANAATHVGQSAADGGFEPLTEAQIKSVNTPAMIVTGAQSPVFLRRLAGLLAALLPNSRKMDVPSASHAMHVENPDAVNAGLLRFLTENAARS